MRWGRRQVRNSPIRRGVTIYEWLWSAYSLPTYVQPHIGQQRRIARLVGGSVRDELEAQIDPMVSHLFGRWEEKRGNGPGHRIQW